MVISLPYFIPSLMSYSKDYPLPLFFSADFGDYNQFDSQDFLREYVLFPMVSVSSFFLIHVLSSLDI